MLLPRIPILRRRPVDQPPPPPVRFDEHDLAAAARWIRARFPDCDTPDSRAAGLLAELATERNTRSNTLERTTATC